MVARTLVSLGAAATRQLRRAPLSLQQHLSAELRPQSSVGGQAGSSSGPRESFAAFRTLFSGPSDFPSDGASRPLVPVNTPHRRMNLLPDSADTYPRQLVVMATGPDRPGIVSQLTKYVLDFGGNVEDSRMARLAGDFAILMLISVDAAHHTKAAELRDALLDIDGLTVNTRWTKKSKLHEKAPKLKFRRISLKGADNPGLVHTVAQYLAANNINIENLETSTQEAPFGGATLFTMDGVITMPLDSSTRQLEDDLDELQSKLGVEIVITNLDPS